MKQGIRESFRVDILAIHIIMNLLNYTHYNSIEGKSIAIFSPSLFLPAQVDVSSETDKQ